MAATATRSTRTPNRATRCAARRSTPKVEARKVVPLLTHDLLVVCYDMGEEWGFNRRVNEKVKTLPKRHVYPVVESFPHFHAGGLRVAEHVRCWVAYNFAGDCLMVDIPKAMFDALPRG
jgi:hypothetical protein